MYKRLEGRKKSCGWRDKVFFFINLKNVTGIHWTTGQRLELANFQHSGHYWWLAGQPRVCPFTSWSISCMHNKVTAVQAKSCMHINETLTRLHPIFTVTEHTKQGKGVTPKKNHHGEHVETWYEQRIKTVRRKIVEKVKKRKGSMTSYLLNL